MAGQRVVKHNQQRKVSCFIRDDDACNWLLGQMGCDEITHTDIIALWDMAEDSDLTVEQFIDAYMAGEIKYE